LRRFSKLLLSLVIAGVLLVILFRWGDVSPGDLAETLKGLPASVYFKALGVHGCIYLLRAARFRVLLPPDKRPGFFALLAVSSSHNLAAYVLPAKTGEGTLVVYLRKVCGVPAGQGLASLVVSRLLDLATLALLLSVATLGLAARGVLSSAWSYPLGALLAVGAATLFVLAARSDWLVSSLTWGIGCLGLGNSKIGSKLSEKADGIALAFREAGGSGRLRLAAALSIPLWMGVFGFYYVLAGGFGLGDMLGVLEATFASSWAVLANLLPVNGFAGAGTQEWGWTYGFTRVGVEESVAISSGLGTHIVQLGNVVLFGLIGHGAMAVFSRKDSA
jgi:hypothetical protein